MEQGGRVEYTRATTALRSAGFRRLIDDILKSIIEQQVQPAAEVAARALRTMTKKMEMGKLCTI